MNELDYEKKLNKNTIECWFITNLFIIISYISGIITGSNPVMTGVAISVVISIPVLIAWLCYRKDNSSKKIKYIFTVGYLGYYTSIMFINNGGMNYVYIFPMIAILIVYCDRVLVGSTFAYTILLNVITIALQIQNILPCEKSMMRDYFTQMIAIISTLFFMYKSSKLLILKNDIFTDILDDIYEDCLTGLKNVRFIEDSLTNRFDYKKNDVMCIAFIDIDDFKQFNTKYGHSVGDVVLKHIANTFLKYVAYIPHTYAIRNGGDEFMIVSRTMSSVDFVDLLNRIRIEICESHPEFLPQDDSVSISIGIASKVYDRNCKTFRELCDVADARNHQAKTSGKNKIVSK